jgi:hypothetical protein
MNSDKDKIYMQIVIFDEIYNFVVQTFSFEGILRLKNDTGIVCEKEIYFLSIFYKFIKIYVPPNILQNYTYTTI